MRDDTIRPEELQALSAWLSHPGRLREVAMGVVSGRWLVTLVENTEFAPTKWTCFAARLGDAVAGALGMAP